MGARVRQDWTEVPEHLREQHVRFDRMTSALDRLADALRRADATWRGNEVVEWASIAESEKDQWRAVAQDAATAVCEEVTAGSSR